MQHRRRIVALAVDFCGGIVGEAPEAVSAANAHIPDLSLSAAKPIKEWTADETARRGIRAALAVELDDPVRFAAISDLPSIETKLAAMFTVDGSGCSASGRSDKDTFSAISSRMDADKRWTPAAHSEKPRTASWNRTTAGGAKIEFILYNEDTLTFNRVTAKFPPTTPTAIRPLVQQVAEECVNGVLDGTDMNVGTFTRFYPYRRVDDVGHVAQMRTYIVSPRAFLNASSFRKEFECELSFGTVDTPAEELRAVMVEVIGGFEGVAKKSDNEWHIKRSGKKHVAQVTTEVDPRGLVLLQIKTLGGHS